MFVKIALLAVSFRGASGTRSQSMQASSTPHLLASVAERSIALDCKSNGLRPTQVRILPGAQKYYLATVSFFLWTLALLFAL